MRRAHATGMSACLLVMACAGVRASAEEPKSADWRKVATPADRARLRNWRTAWVDALAMVRARPDGVRLVGEPILFDPDRALADTTLPVGDYRCRTIKLGAKATETRVFVMQGWVDCAVGREGMSLTFAIAGTQHAAGHLFDDTDARKIFLGALALGDERRPMRYGRDHTRDMAGVLERIGPKRWRIVLPYPGFESTLDLIEIAGRDGVAR